MQLANRKYRPQRAHAIFALLSFLLFEMAFGQTKPISDYRIFSGIGRFNGSEVIVIRSYKESGKLFYIGVGCDNLETYVIASAEISLTNLTWADVLKAEKGTAYANAIETAKSQSVSLQDAGIRHGYFKDNGIALTIDLCPSHKPLDRVIFTSLLQEFAKFGRPVPVGLSITGKFFNSHRDDINWLLNLERSGDLDITWIDHTYDHRYDPKLPLPQNFLLESGTNVNYEILELEKTLLENGILFSVFFRFPGLVSDARLVEKITDFGLIPVGSDAWLAKNQSAKNGDIVLIHGNGNEPLGVEDFIALLRQEKQAVTGRQWLLYDLRENVADEFRKTK